MGRPRAFLPCYVCLREFGSRSIALHEPRCLERWRSANRALPVGQRSPTPVKLLPCGQCRQEPERREEQRYVEMTGAGQPSPKKGKENRKDDANQAPLPAVVGKKLAKHPANAKEKLRPIEKGCPSPRKQPSPPDTRTHTSKENEEDDAVSSTSQRSVRPQTKILRRPTPNLNHPVIQVDSDDSSGDSSSSDKAKADNPKRLKMGNESDKPKNFIMYNKYNVERNTKNLANRERSSANSAIPSIPNPCNSCSRSQAPERLHSHAKKDSRGLMHSRKSPSLDAKLLKSGDSSTEEAHKPKTVKCDRDGPDTAKRKDKASPARAPRTAECPPVLELSLVPETRTVPKDLSEILKSCYVCQKEFRVTELLLHESKCLESWKRTNNSLTPNLRQLPPRRPAGDDCSDVAWAAVQSQLVPCDACGRTFFPERLPVHRRVCKGRASPGPLKRAASLREQPSAPPPEGVSGTCADGLRSWTSSLFGSSDEVRSASVYMTCFVCGRSYGSWVISMHEQKCLRRYRTDKDDNLPEDEQRRFLDLASEKDAESLAELGDTAWESHLQQLLPCPSCSRTFFPDRLDVHMRSCKGLAGGRRPRSNKGS